MNVQGVMTAKPISCHAATSLHKAAQILALYNCGILPIVNERRHVFGVVTDRDLSTALGAQDSSWRDKTVGEITSGKVHFCRQQDEISTALQKMAENKVRRLVVLDDADQLVGVLSMDDVVLFAEEKTGCPDVSANDVLKALKSICAGTRRERVATATR